MPGTKKHIVAEGVSVTSQLQTDENGNLVTTDEKQVLGDLPLDKALVALATNLDTGLSSEQAQKRIEIVGPNSIPQYVRPAWLQFLMYMWNPLSWVMEMAAFAAIVLTAVTGDVPDWEDFIGIMILLFVNATLAFVEESSAGNAVAALTKSLAAKAKVLRDGTWATLEAAELVPGDIIELNLGDIIPADGRVLGSGTKEIGIKIDQAALTGESLPVSKHAGSELYSGATVKQGNFRAIVTGTGLHTFFGKAAHLVDISKGGGHFQEVLVNIGNFCLCWIITFLILEIVTMYPAYHYSYVVGINNLIVLLIGGIPIAMPTVLSVTLAIGAHFLATKGAIVTRMTSIQELAAVDILCSDKTGTLTLNKLSIAIDSIALMDPDCTIEHCLKMAAYASRTDNPDAIDTVVLQSLPSTVDPRKGIDPITFIPFDPERKRTEMWYRDQADGKIYVASKGLPSMLLKLVKADAALEKNVNTVVDDLATRGLRTLAVAQATAVTEEDPNPNWRLLGIIPMLDPPRHDTAATISRALDLGVIVKMLTGDALSIAKETARRLEMGTAIYQSSILDLPPEQLLAQTGAESRAVFIEGADGFAGVFPEHKHRIVVELQSLNHRVAMTGDGVNDAPALKAADVGVAVSDATDAARAASAIVLTEAGLSVIADAIIASREIFQRMRAYSVYACGNAVRIVLTFSILLWTYKFNMPPFMILIMALLNDLTILAISRDRVAPSQVPETWALKNLFIRAMCLGFFQAVSTVVFYIVLYDTRFVQDRFNIHAAFQLDSPDRDPNDWNLHSLIYLQSSILGQGSIFTARNLGDWSRQRFPGYLLCTAFVVAQLVATFIAVYADWGFCKIQGFGWNFAGVVWIWSITWWFPMVAMDTFVVKLQMNWRRWLSWDRYAFPGLNTGPLSDATYLQSTTHHHHPRHNHHGRKEVSELAMRTRARAGLTATEVDKQERIKQNTPLAERKEMNGTHISALPPYSPLSHTATGTTTTVPPTTVIDLDAHNTEPPTAPTSGPVVAQPVTQKVYSTIITVI